jgi:predicted nucleic acid-binding protein
MVIVDTSVMLDYLADRVNAQTEWLDRQSDLQRLGITTLIQCEILQGIRREGLFTETLTALRQFAIFETGSEPLALASARNYRALRGLGVTIRNTIDCLIATFCIAEDHELLHRDRDFDAFETHLGLRVVHPPAIPLA